MMNILVTGGAGYIGSHCCKKLKESGYNPIVFDNFVYGHKDFVQWGPCVYGDIGDSTALERCFDQYDISALIHFAAFAYVGESVQDPEKYYTNNVAKGLNLLNVAVRRGVRRMIFSSTCATYGDPQYVPIDERHPQVPVNPYGRSKFMFESILADYERAYGLKHINLRYFNAAGADAAGDIGEKHNPETHLIPLIIAAALDSGKEIKVFGGDYPTSDGTCIRDYIHVSDLAAAHLCALKKLLDGGDSGCFNLGTGQGYSVLEVIKAVSRVTGCPVRYEIVDRREGDPAELVAANVKAYEKLGWQPNESDLDSIVRTAWQWHKKNY